MLLPRWLLLPNVPPKTSTIETRFVFTIYEFLQRLYPYKEKCHVEEPLPAEEGKTELIKGQ